MTQMPHAEPAALPDSNAQPTHVRPGARCIRCGYELAGLPLSGVCPECAVPVEHSLRGFLLQFSAPEYLARLHQGVFFVQAAIIGSLLLFFGGFAFAFSGLGGSWVPSAVLTAGVVLAGATAYGWWQFSTPDPAQAAGDKGERPRQIIRIATLVGVGVAVAEFVIQLTPTVTRAGGDVLLALVGVSRIVSIAATVAAFFAAMLYLRWLAPRLPDARVAKRAKMLMWLGPLLYTVGLLLVGLGPLIALVLYYNLLDWVRKDLKALRAAQA